MSEHTDKSLTLAAAQGGWGAPRSFSEPGVGPTYPPDHTFVLRHLAVHLELDPHQDEVRGRARVEVGPLAAPQAGPAVLHLDECEVLEVKDAKDRAVSWRHSGGRLELPPVAEPDTWQITWRCRPRRGLYRVGPTPDAPEREWQWWSQCQDEDAHFFIPCFDHPSVKHPVEVTLDVPAACVTVGNGALTVCEPLPGGRRRWVWREERPIPAYLLTVVVGRFDVHTDDRADVPLRYLVPPGTSPALVERAFGRTPAMVACLAERFGTRFPWPRYDQVVVGDFIFGGMENAGATTLTDVVLVSDEAALTVDLDDLVLHELAHQWFGDLVTCADWSQGWLNEGWATFSEVVWLEDHAGPGAGAMHALAHCRSYLAEASDRYRRSIVHYGFREPIDLFDRHLYEKGASVLHLLRAELGEAAFWTGVRTYLARHAWGTVHTRDFQRALEEVGGVSLEGFFRQWVHGAGHPELEAEVEHASGLLTVSVKQGQKGVNVPEVFNFSLVVVVHHEDGRQERHRLAVRARLERFALPCPTAPRRVALDPGHAVPAAWTWKGPREGFAANLAEDACPTVRLRSAEALAVDPRPADVQALLKAFASDPDRRVRAELAGVIAALPAAEAREALVRQLGVDSDARVRQAVAAAVGRTREVALADALVERFGVEPSLGVRAEIGAALGELRSPRVHEVASALLARPGWADKGAEGALRGLGASRDPAAVTTVRAHLEPVHGQRVRAAAAGALARLADELPELRSAARQALEPLCAGPFRVAMAACNALKRLRDPASGPVLRRAHASALDPRVRRAAWEALQAVQASRSSDQSVANLRRELEALQAEHRKLVERIDKRLPRA